MKQIDWKKIDGFVPAVIVDQATKLVLMLGYMNKAALEKTQKTGFVWLYSRTKKRLWKKGETSGNTLKVVDFKLDCDQDALLVKVIPNGPTCHTGDKTCWKEVSESEPIRDLFETITKRKQKPQKGSYTNLLLKSDLDKVLLKIAEESLEVIHAVQKETNERVTEEAVDLIYHLFVLLTKKEITLRDIETEIIKRKK